MAADKLVDSLQLDSDLNSVANAILNKSGGTGPIAFPSGFVSEIQAIPSGSEDTLGESLLGKLVNYESDDVIALSQYAFYYNNLAPEHLRLPNCTQVGRAAFQYSGRIETFFAPKATLGADCFYGASHLVTCVSKASSYNGNSRTFGTYGNVTALTTVDFTDPATRGLTGNMFQNSKALTTLILRGTTIYSMYATTAFDGTCFASGGAGGTIYIPKALYDHLGDGTALDYKATTNWSTINGYGTITWAKIEGSIYETTYADGTPIPTT